MAELRPQGIGFPAPQLVWSTSVGPKINRAAARPHRFQKRWNMAASPIAGRFLASPWWWFQGSNCPTGQAEGASPRPTIPAEPRTAR